MNSRQVDVHVTVKTIMSNYKRDPSEVAFIYPSPAPVAEITSRQIDPDYVAVQLLFQGKDQRDFVLNMLMSKQHAKKLNLMVGDQLTLRISKDTQ